MAEDTGKFAKLSQEDRGLKLRKSKIEPEERALADLHSRSQGRMTLVVKCKAALIHLLIIGQHHSAIAGGNGLVDVEAAGDCLAD